MKATGERRIHTLSPKLHDGRRRRWEARCSPSDDDESSPLCGLGCVSNPNPMVTKGRLTPATDEVMLTSQRQLVPKDSIFNGDGVLSMQWP